MGKIIVHDSFRYAKSPYNLIIDKNVTDGAKNLFNYMLVKSGIDNWKFSRTTATKELCISTDTYARYIKNLENNHWIESHQNRVFTDNKGNTRRHTDYDLYLNKNDHPALSDNNHNKHRYKNFNDLKEKASKDPLELYKYTKDILYGFEFSMPLNALDLLQPANVLARIKVNDNGMFEDEVKEIVFNLDSAKLVWNYLWANNLDGVFDYIKQNRR